MVRVYQFFCCLVILLSSCSDVIRYERYPDLTRFTVIKRKLLVPKGSQVYDCGPEALAAVLNYQGANVDVEEVQAEIYNPRLKGTLSLELAPFARKKGLYAKYCDGSIERIKSSVRNDTPPIIMIKVSNDLFHFFVVTGYSDERGEILCQDFENRGCFIPMKELEKIWGPCGYYFLEITKKPDFDMLFDSANDALNRNDLNRAKELFEKAFKIKQDDSELLNNYAHVLAKLRIDLKFAEELARGAVNMLASDERLPYALGTLGQVLMAQGKFEAALDPLKKSLSLSGNVDKQLKKERLKEIAESLQRLGRNKEAEEYLKALQDLK